MKNVKRKKIGKKPIKTPNYNNFEEVKKPPSKPSKKKQRLKINLKLEEALKLAFSPPKLLPIKK